MANSSVVRAKCARCKMRAGDHDGRCRLCRDELLALSLVAKFDYYFWGLAASRDEPLYFVRIYHDCSDFEWLIGKMVRIDPEIGVAVAGIVAKAESMQDPPFHRGDVVAVTLDPL